MTQKPFLDILLLELSSHEPVAPEEDLRSGATDQLLST